jgi:adenosylhomocysteinase
MRTYNIKDINLADEGKMRIEWAKRDMPVLTLIRERFEKEKPLAGIRIGGCMHITTETANLALTLQAGGADIVMCASNPLSTQDDVAAALTSMGIYINAIKGEDDATYYSHINAVLEHEPQITMDDGADLVTTLNTKRRDLLHNIIGGTEETTTGVVRLQSMEKNGRLEYPVIDVNDAQTKHFFDNRYGTGQSTVDGINRATNILWAGRTAVISGYGWCGRGLALRVKGLGSKVIVCEVDPIKALEAAMEGYEVMPIAEAAKKGDIYVTVTGDKNVISESAFANMKDGAVMANSGHFNSEIDIPALTRMSVSHRTVRPMVEEYTMPDGRRLNLIAEGRLVNLSAAEGHPASVMDMSFANQALSVEYLIKNQGKLTKHVYAVPEDIDRSIAELKLKAMGIEIDTLTEEQIAYLNGWEEGT